MTALRRLSSFTFSSAVRPSVSSALTLTVSATSVLTHAFVTTRLHCCCSLYALISRPINWGAWIGSCILNVSLSLDCDVRQGLLSEQRTVYKDCSRSLLLLRGPPSSTSPS